MPVDARVTFLLHDYAHFVRDTEAFCQRLQALRELRGAAVVAQWQALARSGQVAQVVHELLLEHYDPVYTRSMHRNFSQLQQAQVAELGNGDPATLQAAARQLLMNEAAVPGLVD
jgi:tRNA 2-selenouridine synthase